MSLDIHRNDLNDLLKACIKNKRFAQKELYKMFYSYGMSICMRYTNSREDAVEIMNDGFMKVFTHLKKFDLSMPFQPWFRRILINCAIDHFKKENKHKHQQELDDMSEPAIEDTNIDTISYEEILDLIRLLSPTYQTVFNLHAIEGYKHEEIAAKLGISIGTSKSNYFKGKQKLQEHLKKFFEVNR